MASNHHEDEIFKDKKVPKTPIKFKLVLNEEQKQAKELILNNTLTLIAGKAGSGKTLLACQIALDGLFKKQFEKIIITRPTVSKEEIGFLPGDLHQNMYLLYDKEKIKKHIETSEIEIVPVSFMRGRTFLDCCVIVDEAQNVTMEQMEMIVTRIGLRSKMIICGDDAQVDLKNRKDSGFKFLYQNAEKVDGLAAITLKENHRDPIVDKLLDLYEEEHSKKKSNK